MRGEGEGKREGRRARGVEGTRGEERRRERGRERGKDALSRFPACALLIFLCCHVRAMLCVSASFLERDICDAAELETFNPL